MPREGGASGETLRPAIMTTADVDLIFYLGLVFLLKLSCQLVLSSWAAFQTYMLPLLSTQLDLVGEFGEWAVVTGASRGIGKEYAKAASYNLCTQIIQD